MTTPLETLNRKHVVPLYGLGRKALDTMHAKQVAEIEAGRLDPAVAGARYMRLQAALTRRREQAPLRALRRYVERAVAL